MFSVGPKGAQYLAKALLNGNCSLEGLFLDAACICDEGVKYFSLPLAQPVCSLTILDLGGNDISDEGMINIANALRTNQTLRMLDLVDNNISQR